MHELIYVITGKQEPLVNAECENLLDKLLQPQERPTGLFNADPSQVCASEVLDELRTVPFLTDKRVVVIKGADDFVSKNRSLLESYFDKPCPTGILILTVNTWPPKTKLAKKLPKVGKLIKTVEPKPWQLPRRLIEYARDAHGKKITTDSAELLVELVGDEGIFGLDLGFEVKRSFVIWGDQLLRRGGLRMLEKIALHSPLVVWAPFASNVYHDLLWYPTVGKACIKRFSQTPWGGLFNAYARNGPLREGHDG